MARKKLERRKKKEEETSKKNNRFLHELPPSSNRKKTTAKKFLQTLRRRTGAPFRGAPRAKGMRGDLKGGEGTPRPAVFLLPPLAKKRMKFRQNFIKKAPLHKKDTFAPGTNPPTPPSKHQPHF